MEQKSNNIVDIHYQQTGEASATNELGMREMQVKAYEARDKRFLLIKGSSRIGQEPCADVHRPRQAGASRAEKSGGGGARKEHRTLVPKHKTEVAGILRRPESGHLLQPDHTSADANSNLGDKTITTVQGNPNN